MAYRDCEDVERESDGYEVKASDPEGRRVEIDAHPVTVEIIKEALNKSLVVQRRRGE